MTARPKSLDRLNPYDKETGDLVVVVETPKGSRSKYAYDGKAGTFDLKFVLPDGLTFPVDFGFVPSTLGQDGDPLDAILLLDEPLAVGTKLTARLVGALKAEEREQDGTWERNDWLIAVATHAHRHEHVRALQDLRPGLLDELEGFFEHYNRLHGKQFRVKKRVDARTATKLVKKGIAAAKGA